MLKMIKRDSAQAPYEVARTVRFGAQHQMLAQQHKALYAERGRLDDEIRGLSAKDRNKSDIAARITALNNERDAIQSQIYATKAELLPLRAARARNVEAALRSIQADAARTIIQNLEAMRAALAVLHDCRAEVAHAGGEPNAVPAAMDCAHIENLAHRFAG